MRPPTAHGEILTSPSYTDWEELARANARAVERWDFPVAGVPVSRLRHYARRQAIAEALAFSTRLGVSVMTPEPDPGLIVMTGHQPDLYHPGVWIKNFLLQRLTDDTGATGINLVVDSNGFDVVELRAPRLGPTIGLFRQPLFMGGECYAYADSPSAQIVNDFRTAGMRALSTLPTPAPANHFARFCDALASARADARNLAELLTTARRRYEEPARTRYLELPMTKEARGEAFLSFFVDLALKVERFHSLYNIARHGERRRNRTRSSTHLVPELARHGDLWEFPFWYLGGRARSKVWIRPGDPLEILADEGELARLPRDPRRAVEAFVAAAPYLAPKAVTLTMYNRVFLADLFIHGLGGGRYDQMTDRLLSAFYGIQPPRFVVASMTMQLPLEAQVSAKVPLQEARMRLHRLLYHPEQNLDEVAFADAAERKRAEALAQEKSRLVAEIQRPDADRRALGIRLREVNLELSLLLRSLSEALREEIAVLQKRQDDSRILTDRTYPFCLFDPLEMCDRAHEAAG